MRRALLLLMTGVLLVASCTSTPAGTASGSPSRTVDIKRTRLDIVYSAFVDQDVHHVTSKKALEAALEAVKAAVRGAVGRTTSRLRSSRTSTSHRRPTSTNSQMP